MIMINYNSSCNWLYILDDYVLQWLLKWLRTTMNYKCLTIQNLYQPRIIINVFLLLRCTNHMILIIMINGHITISPYQTNEQTTKKNSPMVGSNRLDPQLVCQPNATVPWPVAFPLGHVASWWCSWTCHRFARNRALWRESFRLLVWISFMLSVTCFWSPISNSGLGERWCLARPSPMDCTGEN